MHALERLGEQVLVGHRDDRHGDPDHATDLRGEHAGRVDDDLGRDRAALTPVLDGHAGDPAAVHADADDAGVGPDRHAALPCPGGECLGEPRRVEPAVGRQPHAAQDAVGRHQREAVAGLGRRDEVHRQAERLGPAGLPLELLHPRRRRGQADRADLVPGGVDAGLGLEPAVEVGAVHHHLGEGHRAPQLADQPGAVEGRAARQLGTVDEDDVGPATLGQVVGDRRPADAPADDHRPGVLHRRSVAAALGRPSARPARLTTA